MYGHGGGRAAGQDMRVWILGTAHPAADRSIKWDEDFGNLSDPDVLIVDLTTLTADILQRTDKDKLDQARTSIADKILYGGTVVVITQPKIQTLSGDALAGRRVASPLRIPDYYHIYSNYDALPVFIRTREVPDGYEIRVGDGHPFKEYIDAVESFGFLIDIDDDNLPPGPTGAREAGLCRVQGWDITDNSGHQLGLALTGVRLDHRGRPQGDLGPGRMILLPPPTGPIGEAIERILSIYEKIAPAGRPVAQPAQREKAYGPMPAKNGDTADRRQPLPAKRARQGDAESPGGAPPGAAGGPPAPGRYTHDVFLSYSHEDKDSVARPLAEGLAKRGVSVWWDQSAMGIGDNLPQKIREGLTKARHGVAVVSKEYLDSGWGQTELGGMFFKNLSIFPILYGVTAEEAQKKLPALSEKLMRPWSDSPESIMDEIADAIEDRGGGADQGGPSASAHGEPPQERDSPATAVAARTSAKARPRAGGAPGMLPSPCRPSPDTERLLAGRKILSPESTDFAQNAHFAGLYAGSLGDGEKPAVLFTAVPHDLGACCDATAPDFIEWARSATSVEVDGRQIRMLGTKWSIDIGTLAAVESHPETAGRNVVLYREFQSGGLFEWGTSYLFFGRNDRNKVELHLCYMVGEFWAFLASARFFYKKIGFDAPFSILLSVRNTRSLDLLNIGNEVYDSGWDIRRRFSPAPPDPATKHDHIQLPYTFSSTREMTDERIASAAKRAATDVCNAYGQAAPACYDEGGSFSWRLWDEIASVATRGGRL